MDNSDSELFYLKWNNFQDNLATGFADLLQDEAMVDVTLAVEGKIIQAHKIILSVCSSYFKTMFQANPCKHPIIVLKDVGYRELTDLLDFMYKGEARVTQEDLPAFLKLAEILKIRGLANSQTEKADALNVKKSDIKVTHESENLENKEIFIRKKRKRAGCPFKPLGSKSASQNEKNSPEEEGGTPGKKIRSLLEEFSSFKEEIISDEDETSQIEKDEARLQHTRDDEGSEGDLIAGPSGLEETNDAIPQGSGSESDKIAKTPIWKYFDRCKENRTAFCKVCGREMSCIGGTTTSITKHLMTKHPVERAEYLKQKEVAKLLKRKKTDTPKVQKSKIIYNLSDFQKLTIPKTPTIIGLKFAGD